MNAEFQAVRDAADLFVRCYDRLLEPTPSTSTVAWIDQYQAEMNADFAFQRLKTQIQNTKHYTDQKPARNL